MLVLTRKTGQKLIIANNIEITVLETKGEAVKLGISAPKDISIYREEIYEEIKKANQSATAHAGAQSLNEAMNLIKPGLSQPSSPPKPEH